MHLKDYYEILQIPTSATLPEIKKAYRKLAQQFHPDKNNNDAYATAQFTEIKEAYEVLTNPAKKEYYLQQRWYEQSIGKRTKQQVITPVTILQKVLELERYVSQLDVFRMDKEGLRDYTLELLSEDTIRKLISFNEPSVCKEIIAVAIRSIKPLPASFTPGILKRLLALAGTDEPAIVQIKEYERKSIIRHNREKYSLIIIIIVTIILCLFIWLAGR
jgi:hypothetical protein